MQLLLKNRTLTYIQTALEVSQLIMFTFGLTWFLYIGSFLFLPNIAFAITSLIFSLVTKNKTSNFTITNMVLSLLVWIPFLGSLVSIAGIVMSSLVITRNNSYLRQILKNPENLLEI
jgi:hypothetical protein